MYNRFEDPDHIKWAYEVKKRDKFTCQICQAHGVPLHSHHLNSFDTFIKDRFDVENGITLCVVHHEMFHSIYGKGKNTKFQFREFEQTLELIRKVARKSSM